MGTPTVHAGRLFGVHRGVLLVALAGVVEVVAGCGGGTGVAIVYYANPAESELGAPATNSSRLVQLVPEPSTITSIKHFRGTVIDKTGHSIDWAGASSRCPGLRRTGRWRSAQPVRS